MRNKQSILYISLAIILVLGGYFVYTSQSAQQNYQNQVEQPVVVNTEMPVIKNSPTPTPHLNQTLQFNKAVTLNISQRIVFPDGLIVVLKEINDSRCKPGQQCIWAGELAPHLILSQGSLGTSKDVYLGIIRNQSITVEDYTIALQSATETTATVIVSYKNSTSRIAGGYIAGHVNIGPFCPVEREGEPCKVPTEAYSSRDVYIYLSDKTTIKDKIKLDSEGNYKTAIGPGNYFIQIVPAGIGPGEKKPATVKSFETTTVNFDIDTGIR